MREGNAGCYYRWPMGGVAGSSDSLSSSGAKGLHPRGPQPYPGPGDGPPCEACGDGLNDPGLAVRGYARLIGHELEIIEPDHVHPCRPQGAAFAITRGRPGPAEGPACAGALLTRTV